MSCHFFPLVPENPRAEIPFFLGEYQSAVVESPSSECIRRPGRSVSSTIHTIQLASRDVRSRNVNSGGRGVGNGFPTNSRRDAPLGRPWIPRTWIEHPAGTRAGGLAATVQGRRSFVLLGPLATTTRSFSALSRPRRARGAYMGGKERHCDDGFGIGHA